MLRGDSIQARHLLVIAALLFAIACGSDSTQPDGPDLPDSPDQLILELRNAYEHRVPVRLGELLLPEYEFHFNPIDIDTLGLDTIWTRDRDLEVAQRMWDGGTGIWPDSSWHAPVDLRFPFGLQINAVDSVWTPAGGVDAGSLTRIYRSGMTVQYEDGNLDIVTGRQQFFVVEVPRRGFAVRKWVDLGGGQGVEPEIPSPLRFHVTSWGYVRGVFRQAGPE